MQGVSEEDEDLRRRVSYTSPNLRRLRILTQVENVIKSARDQTMNEREALYRHICENPHDDTARLVFADWLQEHGEDARDEFIRVQCQRASTDIREPAFAELGVREWQLWMCHGEQWRTEVHSAGVSTPGQICSEMSAETLQTDFSRGFAEWLQCRTGSSREVIRRSIEMTPARSLQILGPPSSSWMRETFTSNVLASITGLLLLTTLGQHDFRFVTESPALLGLRHLRLATSLSHQDQLDSLTESDPFPHLKALSLNCSTTPNGETFRRLWTSPIADRLQHLEINDCTRQILWGMARFRFPELRSLHFRSNDHATYLSGALESQLPKLSSWEVHSRFPMRSEDVARLRHWRGQPLARLGFRGFVLAKDLQKLLCAPLAVSLHTLDLSGTPLGEEGIRAIVEAPGLSGLRCLRLEAAALTGSALRLLFSGEFPELTSLSLATKGSAGEVSTAELAEAISAMEFPKLRHLDLSGWPLATRGCRALATHPGLASLRSLVLTGCDIRPNGVAELLNSRYLDGIEFLDLRDNPVRNGIDALEDASVMPNLVRCRLDARTRRRANPRVTP